MYVYIEHMAHSYSHSMWINPFICIILCKEVSKMSFFILIGSRKKKKEKEQKKSKNQGKMYKYVHK